MSPFWHYFISIITLVTLVALTWFLIATRKNEVHKDLTDSTTGHNFDGIEELDNPLPSWWLYLFMISIMFGAIYLALYPGLGNFPGLLGWTSHEKWQEEVDQAEARYGALYNQYLEVPIEQLAQNQEALKMGQRLFSNNCAACHGSDARGNIGYPNLRDHEWLYGGTPDVIKTSISQGRQGMMPAWLGAVGEAGTLELTQYVLQLSGQAANADQAAQGQSKYQMFCIACHGVDGSGNPLLGAPSLIDDVWLYGHSEASILKSIAEGRQGKMPAQKDLLSEARIHVLTAYVYSLSK